ncbi:MAG: hypothetical protein MZW92_63660 [Comamonadaceae bacterium]|nr:hypothetical protein [Comamonadaceae bacterium]
MPGRQAAPLGYFRNNVLHAFAVPALIACLVAHNQRIEPHRLMEIARRLFPFLRSELFLAWSEADLEHALQGYVAAFLRLQLIRERGSATGRALAGAARIAGAAFAGACDPPAAGALLHRRGHARPLRHRVRCRRACWRTAACCSRSAWPTCTRRPDRSSSTGPRSARSSARWPTSAWPRRRTASCTSRRCSARSADDAAYLLPHEARARHLARHPAVRGRHRGGGGGAELEALRAWPACGKRRSRPRRRRCWLPPARRSPSAPAYRPEWRPSPTSTSGGRTSW